MDVDGQALLRAAGAVPEEPGEGAVARVRSLRVLEHRHLELEAVGPRVDDGEDHRGLDRGLGRLPVEARVPAPGRQVEVGQARSVRGLLVLPVDVVLVVDPDDEALDVGGVLVDDVEADGNHQGDSLGTDITWAIWTLSASGASASR